METKKEKAYAHAEKCWGIYFDEIDEDCNNTRGVLTQNSYLCGYEQAVQDSKAPEMLEMLKKIVAIKESGLDFTLDSIKQLIKEATEL